MRVLASLFGRPDVCSVYAGCTLLSARSLREELPYGGFHCGLLPAGIPCFLFLLEEESWLFDPCTGSSTRLLGGSTYHSRLTIMVVLRLPDTPVLWVRDLVLLDGKRVGILDFGMRMLVCRRYMTTLARDTECLVGEAIPGVLAVRLAPLCRLLYFPVFPLSCARWLWSIRTRLPWQVGGLYFVRSRTSIGYRAVGRCLVFHWYEENSLSVIVAPGDVQDCVLPPPYCGAGSTVLYVDDGGRCNRLVPIGTMSTIIFPAQSQLCVVWNPREQCWERTRGHARVSSQCDARRMVAMLEQGCVPVAGLPGRCS